jgi:alpha-D-xyloside xylohydrolase
VPGFHGVPDFMNSRPSDELYVRWTQFGVFSSHLRYHGTSAREPYEYPAVADIVRRWLRLRYALIPYLLDAAQEVAKTGFPVLRAMLFHHPNDPVCWGIDDQFFCGPALLVAPLLNAGGIRNVYLPEGDWVDFWTGEKYTGPQWLRGVQSPLDRLPVFAQAGTCIRIHPDPVQHTGEMDMARCRNLVFNTSFRGMMELVDL